MRRIMLATAIAMAALYASPVGAQIIEASPTDENDGLVHNDGNGVKEGPLLQGTIGSQDTDPPVFLTGTSTDSNIIRFSNGNGQASITGALDESTQAAMDTYLLTSLNIFFDDPNDLFDVPSTYGFIELGLFGATEGADILFTLYNAAGQTFEFDHVLSGSGVNRYAFAGINGQSISQLSFSITDGGALVGIDATRQIRIADPNVAPVPEPSTWAMMLIGFGAVGYSLRRRKSRLVQAV